MLRLSAIAAVLAMAPASASASIIDVTFGGTFNRYDYSCSPYTPGAPNNCASTAISTPLSGSFSYSTTSSYAITGGTVSSDALGSVGRSTTLVSTGPYGNVNLPLPGNTILFNDVLGSLFFQDILSISLVFPASTNLDPANPPPFALAQSASVRFVTNGSPGGTGPSLDGVISSFTFADRASPVPEAGTWFLLLAGAGIAGAALRRSRRRTGQVDAGRFA